MSEAVQCWLKVTLQRVQKLVPGLFLSSSFSSFSSAAITTKTKKTEAHSKKAIVTLLSSLSKFTPKEKDVAVSYYETILDLITLTNNAGVGSFTTGQLISLATDLHYICTGYHQHQFEWREDRRQIHLLAHERLFQLIANQICESQCLLSDKHITTKRLVHLAQTNALVPLHPHQKLNAAIVQCIQTRSDIAITSLSAQRLIVAYSRARYVPQDFFLFLANKVRYFALKRVSHVLRISVMFSFMRMGKWSNEQVVANMFRVLCSNLPAWRRHCRAVALSTQVELIWSLVSFMRYQTNVPLSVTGLLDIFVESVQEVADEATIAHLKQHHVHLLMEVALMKPQLFPFTFIQAATQIKHNLVAEKMKRWKIVHPESPIIADPDINFEPSHSYMLHLAPRNTIAVRISDHAFIMCPLPKIMIKKDAEVNTSYKIPHLFTLGIELAQQAGYSVDIALNPLTTELSYRKVPVPLPLQNRKCTRSRNAESKDSHEFP